MDGRHVHGFLLGREPDRCQAFDARDQMNHYANWYQHGYWSSTASCFDIGVATRGAIHNYLVIGEPLAGNASIMRLAPVALRFSGMPELRRWPR